MHRANAFLLRRRSRQLARSSDLLTVGLLGNIWLDLLLVFVLVAAVVALRRDAWLRPPQAPVVAKPGGIQPFHVIKLEDLRLDGQKDNPPAENRAGAFVGRYSFTFVREGCAVDVNHLSPGPPLTTELANRVLLQLKVQPTGLFAGMNPPFKASLVGLPTERGTTVLLEKDLFVLDLHADGNAMAAVVAIPFADESTLAGFIARSELLLEAEHR